MNLVCNTTFFEELDRLGQGSLHSNGPGHDDLYECLVTVTRKTASRCHSPSDLVFSSSGVLFQAVGCDLVGKVREAVPVSGTAIVPL